MRLVTAHSQLSVKDPSVTGGCSAANPTPGSVCCPRALRRPYEYLMEEVAAVVDLTATLVVEVENLSRLGSH